MADNSYPYHRWIALSAIVCVFLSMWSWWFAWFACAFTWQATVYWCAYRSNKDGRNVWEHTR